MPGIKGPSYAWGRAWIEFKTPTGQGVYCIRNKEGKILYIGKGNLRERLLSHWYKENAGDASVWSGGPHSFSNELTDKPKGRERELLRELKPALQFAA